MKKTLRFVGIILLLLSTALCCFSCKGKGETSSSAFSDRFDLTNQVLDFIKKTYYDDVDYDLADVYTALRHQTQDTSRNR